MDIHSLYICKVRYFSSDGHYSDNLIIPVLAEDEEIAEEKVTKWFNENVQYSSYHLQRVDIQHVII